MGLGNSSLTLSPPSSSTHRKYVQSDRCCPDSDPAPKSVVYVAFGSFTIFDLRQLKHLKVIDKNPSKLRRSQDPLTLGPTNANKTSEWPKVVKPGLKTIQWITTCSTQYGTRGTRNTETRRLLQRLSLTNPMAPSGAVP
ncbi:hypothetical protein QJS10_CPA09g00788 [Acorus calamus]|uniref:Uncharacterized protein n=1 Tax=Acorus calamus TaxID=4465 RepID=A0AAV9E4X5_ACOCL|nr:hypothetical protein QJS10_CPA09g00788 [Acorus calamus]